MALLASLNHHSGAQSNLPVLARTLRFPFSAGRQSQPSAFMMFALPPPEKPVSAKLALAFTRTRARCVRFVYPAWPEIIFISGRDDPLVRQTALDAGAVAFLAKPFDDENLVRLVPEDQEAAAT